MEVIGITSKEISVDINKIMMNESNEDVPSNSKSEDDTPAQKIRENKEIKSEILGKILGRKIGVELSVERNNRAMIRRGESSPKR